MHRTLGGPSGRVRLPRPSRDLRRLLQGNLSFFFAMGLHKNSYNFFLIETGLLRVTAQQPISDR